MKVIGTSNRYYPYRVEIDDYVPLIFEIEASPAAGLFYYRLGDSRYSLIEIKIDSFSLEIRYIGLISVGEYEKSNLLEVIDRSSLPVKKGLPIIDYDVSQQPTMGFVIRDIECNFKLCLEKDRFVVDWSSENLITGMIQFDNTFFVMRDDFLVGVIFSGLKKEQVKLLQHHLWEKRWKEGDTL